MMSTKKSAVGASRRSRTSRAAAPERRKPVAAKERRAAKNGPTKAALPRPAARVHARLDARKKRARAVRRSSEPRVHAPRAEALVPLVYDILFSLMLFFGIEAMFRLESSTHLLLYVTMYAVILHWWLMFKTAEHRIDPGVRDAAHHVVLNIAYILILQIALLLAGIFEHVGAAAAVLALVAVDLLWAWNVREHASLGSGDEDAKGVRTMLDAIVRSDLVFGVPLTALVLLGAVLSPGAFVGLFIFLLASFMVVTYRHGVVDLRHL